MVTATVPITNFTGGEISPRLHFRSDTQKYRNGANVIENMIVVPHGGAAKRGGLQFIGEVKDSANPPIFRDFIFNTEQAYMLEFGNNYIRFYRNGAVIVEPTSGTISGMTQASPGVVTTSSAHGYSNGDQIILSGVSGMTEVNNRRVTIANVTSTTFELDIDTSGYAAWSSGGQTDKPVEVATTYTSAQIEDLDFAQSNDTLYIAHSAHPIALLTRSSHTSWSLADAPIENGPFRTINADKALEVTPSGGTTTAYSTYAEGATGITLTATSALFDAAMVGSLFRLFEPGKGTGAGSPQTGAGIANGNFYSNDGKIYGVSNLTGTAIVRSDWTYPTHEEGTVRVLNIPRSNYFDAVYLHDSSCIVKITGYTSSTVVTVTIVKNHMPDSIIREGTSLWEEGAWSSFRGFPSAITLHEQRLWGAAPPDDPQTIWFSRTAGFLNFLDGAEDDHAGSYTIVSDRADPILWMSSGKTMIVGTASGEFSVAASSRGEKLTPSNVTIKLQATRGSSVVRPVRVDDSVLYGQREGNSSNDSLKMRQITYAFSSDSYNSSDRTIISDHITYPGFDTIAYQVTPDAMIWVRRSDGVIPALTYEAEQEVAAWQRAIVPTGTAAKVLNIETLPGDDGDILYCLVSRTINGATRVHVEKLSQIFTYNDAKEDATCVDSWLTYSGSATTTITGLWHLEGESVDALADGSKVLDLTVTNGTVTLPIAASKVTVGLRYKAIIETLDLDVAAQQGTAKSRPGRVSQVFLQLLFSLGGWVGTAADKMTPIKYRTPSDVMGSSPDLFSGLLKDGVSLPSAWDRKRIIRIEHDEPYPFMVNGLAAELTTNG